MTIDSDQLFADLYESAFLWNPTKELRTIQSFWDQYLQHGSVRVCDIGGGVGRFVPYLVPRCSHYIIVEDDRAMASISSRQWGERGEGREEDEAIVKVVPRRFEDVEWAVAFDSLFLFTDVLSYMWPDSRLQRFLRAAERHLHPSGLLLVDVALWRGYPGERREEEWAIEGPQPRETVYASYESWLVPEQLEDDGGMRPIRVEELAFERSAPRLRETASRQAILHGFTAEGLLDVCRNAGFEPVGFAAVGETEVREPELLKVSPLGRAVVGFHRSGVAESKGDGLGEIKS